MQVQIPDKLEQQLKAGMKEAGIPVPETEERWNQAMNALKVSPARSCSRFAPEHHLSEKTCRMKTHTNSLDAMSCLCSSEVMQNVHVLQPGTNSHIYIWLCA